jgi:hypothetical protein
MNIQCPNCYYREMIEIYVILDSDPYPDWMMECPQCGYIRALSTLTSGLLLSSWHTWVDSLAPRISMTNVWQCQDVS